MSLNSRTIFLNAEHIIKFCKIAEVRKTETMRKRADAIIKGLKSKSNILTLGFNSFLWCHICRAYLGHFSCQNTFIKNLFHKQNVLWNSSESHYTL